MISIQQLSKRIFRSVSINLKIKTKRFVDFKFKQLGEDFQCTHKQMLKLTKRFTKKSKIICNIRNKYVQRRFNRKLDNFYESLVKTFINRFPKKHREQLDFMNVDYDSLYSFSRNKKSEYKDNKNENFFSYRLYFVWISSNYECIDFDKLNLYIEKYYNSKEEFINDFKDFWKTKAKDGYLSINDKKAFERLTEMFEKGEYIPMEFNW